MVEESSRERTGRSGRGEPSLRQAVIRMRVHLTAILGHAQMLRRRIARAGDLSDDERERMERDTSIIGDQGRALAGELDALDPDRGPPGHDPPPTR